MPLLTPVGVVLLTWLPPLYASMQIDSRLLLTPIENVLAQSRHSYTVCGKYSKSQEEKWNRLQRYTNATQEKTARRMDFLRIPTQDGVGHPMTHPYRGDTVAR